jgi:hypothetical protein
MDASYLTISLTMAHRRLICTGHAPQGSRLSLVLNYERTASEAC